MGNTYFGVRTGNASDMKTRVTKIHNGIVSDLPPHPGLAIHNVCGFDWGSVCVASEHLGLAILADASGIDDLALHYHKIFTSEIIARLDRREWHLPVKQVEKWLADAWAPSRDYCRFEVEYNSREPNQTKHQIQQAIRQHRPLFYHRRKVSDCFPTSEAVPNEIDGTPLGRRWRLYIDMGTDDPKWARNEIANALQLHMDIQQLDLNVTNRWILMRPSDHAEDDNVDSINVLD